VIEDRDAARAFVAAARVGLAEPVNVVAPGAITALQAARRGGQRGSGSGSGLMRVRAARMRAAAPARSVAARAASASSSRRA